MNDKEERKERIQLLRRQEDRKNRLPMLIEQVSHITKKEINEHDVLTLEEINNFQISVNCTDFNFNYLNISFPEEEAAELITKLKVLSKQFQEINYLVLPKWADIAVLKVNTEFLIDNLKELIKLGGDSIYLYTLNFKNGLYIDLYNEWWYLDGEAKERSILELRAFGKDWIKNVALTL